MAQIPFLTILPNVAGSIFWNYGEENTLLLQRMLHYND